MEYNFNEVINRRGTDSLKWDRYLKIFGADDLLPMWVADSDWPAPREVINALEERIRHGIFGYTEPGEDTDLVIEDWVKNRYGWDIKKEWLVYSSGVVPAINAALKGFTSPGDGVIIQSPVYYPFFTAIERNQARLVNNQLIFDGEKYLMDFADLEAKLASNSNIKLLILCNPHNPVGRVWTEEELLKLGELSLKYGVFLVSDEIHGDLIYQGYRHLPLASLSQELAQNSITMIAPSKTFNLAGLHCSVNIIPNPEVRETFKKAMDGFVTAGNVLGWTAMKAAYSQGEEWLEAQLRYLEENRDFALEYIRLNIPQVKAVKPEGTYLLWLDFRQLKIGDEELQEFMVKKAKVALDPGIWFGPGGEGHMRLNIACPRQLLKEGLQRIEKAIRG